MALETMINGTIGVFETGGLWSSNRDNNDHNKTNNYNHKTNRIIKIKNKSTNQSNQSSKQMSDHPLLSSSNFLNYSTSMPSSISNIRSLKTIYTNATSLTNKLNELEILIDNYSPHLIGITETWFNKKSTREIDNYVVYSRDRYDTIGGGVHTSIEQI